MKAIFAHRNDAHKLNGIGQEIVEIVGERITVRLSTTGKKADFQVADVKSFDGEIVFGKSDADATVESNDTTPAPAVQPEPAPLFSQDEPVFDNVSEEAVEETQEADPADEGEASMSPKRKLAKK